MSMEYNRNFKFSKLMNEGDSTSLHDLTGWEASPEYLVVDIYEMLRASGFDKEEALELTKLIVDSYAKYQEYLADN